MSDETHVILKTSDLGVHGVEVISHKGSKISELGEDFLQERCRINPLWWRRKSAFIRGLLLCIYLYPLFVHVLTVADGGDRTDTNGKRTFDLYKGLIIQGNLKMAKKQSDKLRIRQSRRDALDHNALCMR